ncbi:hypothetical protein EMIHUDRAFT_464221, partial [Emiliania huxleyi CCMP1516]|uniref:F-box domain-containing protein n=2 Tax=Emiliania huxleyi TaxID=2903 RepID=A0A0D3J1P0_EMIH1
MPGKRPRTAAAASSFDESLDDLEVAVARISGAEPHSVSADQLRRLKELKHLLFRKEMEVDSLARAKKRARVAAEVVLPLDLLTHAFLPLDLKYLVAASQTCRHFKLAVSRAVTVRGNQIGLRQGDAEKLSLKTLAPLEEKAAQVRALMASIDQRSSQQQLIRLLSARSGGSREERALGPLLLCRHEAALWARVEALVKKDAHRTPRAPDTFFEDLNFENGVADQANAYETYLDSLVPELDHLLSLLSGLTRRATRAADSALLVSHAPTLVQLVTASVD